jgi:hypothetical protein
VTEQGVDYPALVASPAYDAYKAAVASLTNYPAEDLLATDAAKVVFFVNLYNTLTIHAFAELGPPAENSLARLLFNSQASYIVGGHRLSLSDIENGILRGNRGVSMWPRPFGTTPESDPRVRLCVDVPEPRIHFVLNCGAASCPPIRFLTVDRSTRNSHSPPHHSSTTSTTFPSLTLSAAALGSYQLRYQALPCPTPRPFSHHHPLSHPTYQTRPLRHTV